MAEPDIVTTPEAAPTPALSALGSQGTREFIRYFLASLIALFVDVGSLAILSEWLSVPYLWAGGIAFLLGLLVVYILSIRWVFESRQIKSPIAEFLLFALIGLVGLLINEGMLWLFTGFLGLHLLASKLLSVVAVFSWNFFARRTLLFQS